MLKIAAGGWHSAAISEFDDLYMFGWNESGQLALPTNLARDGTNPIKQTELAHTWLDLFMLKGLSYVMDSKNFDNSQNYA